MLLTNKKTLFLSARDPHTIIVIDAPNPDTASFLKKFFLPEYDFARFSPRGTLLDLHGRIGD
jgi:hypothetical protein